MSSTLQERIFLLNSHGDFDPVLIAAILGVDPTDVDAVLKDPSHAVSGGGGGGGSAPLTASYAIDAQSGSFAWEKYSDDIGLQTNDKTGRLTLALPGAYWVHIRVANYSGSMPAAPLVDALWWLDLNTALGEEVTNGEPGFIPAGGSFVATLLPVSPGQIVKSDGTLALNCPSLALDLVPLSNHPVADGAGDGVTIRTGLLGLYVYDVTYFG